ncbi:hypothetical protein R1sor_010758 [Riccia sorocarpa]|uniref:Uncharacterized protein n=1 Tax=Riccia sorocarpa TaxID=122646 RepID=A0ABD3I1P7_9MARC
MDVSSGLRKISTTTEVVTINQLLDVHHPPPEFRTVDVSEHYGSVGVVQSNWSEEKQDWYLNGIDFVCIRKLYRGSQSVSGPFRLVRKEGEFIILQAADSSYFSHPRFLRKTSADGEQFTSTLAWMWSRECLCEKNLQQIHTNCLCEVTVRRGFCLRCPDVHKQLAEKKAKEDEEAVDSVLSQNICICQCIVGHGTECFCRYEPSTKHEAPGQNETDNDTTDDSGEESREGTSCGALETCEET